MKSLNLNAYGVEEMSKNEMVETDGGLGFIGVLAAGLILAASTEIIQNWGDFKDGINKGYTD